MPWRTVTDSIGHYLIYTAIHGYTISNDKIKARNELEKCDLSELSKFNPEIQSIIKEIMEPKTKNKTKSDKAINNAANIMNSELDIT